MTIEEIQSRIAEIDRQLDNDALSNAEFDRLEEEARVLTGEMGRIEAATRFRTVKTLVHISDWYITFLSSFDCGTQKITNKQASVFQRLNNGKPFIYNGRRFDCLGPDFRAGFSAVVVTNIDF